MSIRPMMNRLAKENEAPASLSAARQSIHDQITQTIVRYVEEGPAEARLPWSEAGFTLGTPRNAVTGSLYRGVNILTLWAVAQRRGFPYGLWATYKQWQSIGAQVRKGERGTVVVFYKNLAAEEDGQEEESSPRIFARAAYVFNAEQVDGFAPPAPIWLSEVELVGAAEAFVHATGAVIRHGGVRAFYRPADDIIQMPDAGRFTSSDTGTPTEGYYSVLFHELGHWTGHASRCARNLSGRFGSAAYAVEELVAELTAAFLCAELAISLQPREDHASYIASWLEVMKADSRAIFTAASEASRAVDLLQSFSAAAAA